MAHYIGKPNPDYNPVNWQTGDIITEELLNRVQQQVDNLVDGISKIVVVNDSDTPPQDPYNQIWIKRGESHIIPELEDFNKFCGSFAPAYTKGQNYKIGDYVIYNTVLYKCKENITNAPEELDENKWTQVYLVDDIINLINVQDEQPTSELNKLWLNATPETGISVPTYEDLCNVIASEYSSSSTYNIGDYVIQNGYLYICITTISSPETWDAMHWQLIKLAEKAKNHSNVNIGLYNIATQNAIQRINLFDKSSSLNREGCYWSTGGVLTTGADVMFVISHPILVGPGTYKFNATTSYLGSNATAVAIIDYNSNLIKMNNGTLVDNDTAVSVTFSETCLIQFNYMATRASRLVFSKLTDFPNSIGYYSGIPQNISETVEANLALKKITEIFSESKNLFNKLSTENVIGQYWSIDGINRTQQSSSLCKSHPIIIPAGTYKFSSSSATFGANAGAVAVLDINGEMIKIIPATISDNIATFSVDRVSCVQFNFTSTNANSVVFCSAALWDGNYYSYDKKINNALLDFNDFITKENTTFFSYVVGENLLDISNPIANKYFEVSSSQSSTLGELKAYSTVGRISSFYIKINGAGTYSTKVNKNLYGAINAARIALFDINKHYIGIVTGTLGEGQDNNSIPLSLTITNSHITSGVEYVGLTVAQAYIGTTMFIKSSTYPIEYIPYESHWEIPEIIINKDQISKINRSAVDLTESVSKEDTIFFNHQQSTNLLDLSDPVVGKYFNVNDGSLVDYNNRVLYSFYVPLNGSGNYITKVTKNLYGTNAAKITLFNTSKEYLTSVTGTLGESDDETNKSVPNSFTITDTHINMGAVYAGLTVESNYLYNIMFVKSSIYPSSYIPYSSKWVIPELTIDSGQAPTYENNPLYGKEIIFDGDSICAPNTDISNQGGYAGRIASYNTMTMQNYAVSGGTLTSGLYYSGGSARHWVSGTVDTMYTNHPNADYIIFQGGTNDADVIGSIISGSVPTKFGSFEPMDFSGSYDATTFCGAVETIIFKAISYWPKKKIGFIIAPKMGYSGTSYQNRKAYFDKIVEICDKWGVPCLNLWTNCPINPRLQSCYNSSMTAAENAEAEKMYLDGQHPTPTGYNRITPIIEAWLKTL